MVSKDEAFLKLNLKLSDTLKPKFKIMYFNSENRILSTTPFLYKCTCTHIDISHTSISSISIYIYIFIHILKEKIILGKNVSW